MSAPMKKQKLSQNKSRNYYKPVKRQFLELGHRGFLATCNFREKDCVREAYNILNHYADELYGAPTKEPSAAAADDENGDAAGTGDITDDLQKEIDAANASKQHAKGAARHRFQVVDTGVTNCVFIRTTLPDPVELCTRIVSEIARTREQKTRFLLRLLPVEVVCRANVTDITNASGALFDKYFLKQSTTFAIVFNRRYNNDVKRDAVIHELAEMVQSKNIGNRVDLKHAAKTVIVEIIKGLCCLSVVENYLDYKKYNLVELANGKEKTENNGGEAGTSHTTKEGSIESDDELAPKNAGESGKKTKESTEMDNADKEKKLQEQVPNNSKDDVNATDDVEKT